MIHGNANHGLPRAVFVVYLLILGVTYLSSPANSEQKRAARWNPTKVPAGTAFAGDQACAQCHKNIVVSQSETSMAKAMESVADSKILTQNPRLTFRIDEHSYEITRKGDQSIFTLSDGKERISLPILYAFGHGDLGQTYVVRYEDAFYEVRVSYYTEIDGLDFTIGASRAKPATLKDAIGRRLSKDDTLNCFACHSTGAVSGGELQLDKLTVGVRCEACHGPGGRHIEAGRAGKPNADLIFNPARLGADELTQNFCASCHRGTEDLTLLRSMEINNVRFQPYRIFNSKCYSDDQRISCTACHDPHAPLKRDAAFYDAKCMACHTAGGTSKVQARTGARAGASSCPVGTKGCASCHMPEVELPEAHSKFTDHYIRIVEKGSPYPN